MLIAANIFAAFAVLLQPELIDQFGFHPDHPTVQSAFTCLFLHQNIVHLLGNMVFLAAVGASVELATGSFRFASVYFLSGFAGVIVHTFLSGGSTIPLVGASGCVAGCAGYYSARYIGLRVPLAPRISVSVAMVTGFWVFLQALGAVVHLGSEGASISYWSHLGGFAMGLLLSALFRAPDLGERKLGHAVLDEMNRRSPAATIAACERHLKAHPGDTRALREMAVAASKMDDVELEAKTLLALLEFTPELEQSPILERLGEIGHLTDLPALQRTLLADKSKESDPSLSEVLLLSIVAEDVDEPQRPEAMLALASLKWERDRQQAVKILDQLTETYPLHPAVDLARRRGWLT